MPQDPSVRLFWTSFMFLCWMKVFTGGVFGLDKTVTACVGRCSYAYSMECPLGQKVAPKALKYLAKKEDATCPADIEGACQNYKCCEFSGGDCSVAYAENKAFEVYQNCSGMQQCGWFRADSVSTKSFCSVRSNTNYVAASYSCVDDSTFIDICSSGVLSGNTVNLLFNGSKAQNYTGDSTKLCSCVVSTANCDSPARLQFTAVDIRLHQYHDITSCHPHSRFTITEVQPEGSTDFHCQKNHFYKGLYGLYYSYEPYARVSLANVPGLFPSQFWLQIKATMPNIDVVVTCGSSQPESFCGPVEMFTTTEKDINIPEPTPEDIFGDPNKPGNGEDDKKPGDSNCCDDDTMKMTIVWSVSGSLVLIAIIVVIIICVRRRRRRRKNKRPKILPEPVPLSPSTTPLESFPSSDSEDKYGNYYETMACENGELDNKSPFTPGKSMGSFFPNERKISAPCAPVIPVVPPVVPPVAQPRKQEIKKVPPVAQPRKPDIKKIENPYHAPWDGAILQGPNRVKRNDLAYATSDEIQVLIQRMESEKSCLNEGPGSPAPNMYIHIDDYKNPPNEKEVQETGDNNELYVYENDDSDEESEHDNGETEGNPIMEHDDGELDANEGTPKSTDNFGSEDTGYRSVGSPEQVLVSEDDYLVPGSVKSAVSSTNSKAKDLPEGHRESVSSNSYAQVYDALEEGKNVDVKTKL